MPPLQAPDDYLEKFKHLAIEGEPGVMCNYTKRHIRHPRQVSHHETPAPMPVPRPGRPVRGRAGAHRSRARTHPGAKPRNVVFILSDDHRYDAMSFLGHQFAKTPVMDSLAENGAYLKNALVTTSLCSPSRASILTGLYTFRHRVIDNNRPSRPARSIFRNTSRRPVTPPASSANGTWAGKATTRNPAGITGSASPAKANTCRPRRTTRSTSTANA
jgi:hypothetical protein